MDMLSYRDDLVKESNHIKNRQKKYVRFQLVFLVFVATFRILYLGNGGEYPQDLSWLIIPDVLTTIIFMSTLIMTISLNSKMGLIENNISKFDVVVAIEELNLTNSWEDEGEDVKQDDPLTLLKSHYSLVVGSIEDYVESNNLDSDEVWDEVNQYHDENLKRSNKEGGITPFFFLCFI